MNKILLLYLQVFSGTCAPLSRQAERIAASLPAPPFPDESTTAFSVLKPTILIPFNQTSQAPPSETPGSAFPFMDEMEYDFEDYNEIMRETDVLDYVRRNSDAIQLLSNLISALTLQGRVKKTQKFECWFYLYKI